MSKKPTAETRHRDLDGEIRRRNETTKIDTLRKTYGSTFARGYGGNAKLGTLLDASGVRSLGEYLKRR